MRLSYANVILNANGRQMEIDSRPSDAIAIALRVSAPIYVEPSVLEKAGALPENETEQYTTVHLQAGNLSNYVLFPS